MSIVILVLLLIFLVLIVFALPLAFDIGYESGRENALKKVAAEIPQGLSLEQHTWVSKQMESRS
jgi:hypothetical protein